MVNFVNVAPPEPEIHTQTASSSKTHRIKAAIFHKMAFKMSLEINNNKLTISTKTAFFKVPYEVCRVLKKEHSI